MAQIDPRFQAELNEVITRLKRLEPHVRKNGKADMLEAAQLIASAVKGAAPIGTVVHKRYYKRSGKKAGKGFGRVAQTYKPGNLKKSFRVLNFRRSEAAFVGARLGKSLPDGYYSHMVEYDTAINAGRLFFQRAINASSGPALRFAVELIKRRVESYGVQNGFK
jgi:hypothetical protein